jgi:hypothetical protein
VREYHYRIDGEGRVFHAGTEIVDPGTLRFFLRAMTRTADGRWLVVCQGERNWFEPEDTPWVVQRLRFDLGPDGLRTAELCFAGDYREPLDPASLHGEGGRVYCRVRGGAFRARFGRIALQQLAPFLVEEGARPVLVLGGRRYPIELMDGSDPGRPGSSAERGDTGHPGRAPAGPGPRG